MKAENIRVGMTLEMKNEVFVGCNHADGKAFTSPYVIITAIKCKPGRRRPYIYNARGDAFRSSDFRKALDFQPVGAE